VPGAFTRGTNHFAHSGTPADKERAGEYTRQGHIKDMRATLTAIRDKLYQRRLSRYLRGWIGYFGKCETPSVLAGLEQWLRRRLRSAIWKRWQRVPGAVSELRRRAVNADLAAQTARRDHGPCRLADSPALSIALPNAYFDSLGIPRLTVKPIA
jgi:hypothetical protein